MFSLTKKSKRPEEALLPSFEDDAVARIAAREDGVIIYASPSFQDLCGPALSPEIHNNVQIFFNGALAVADIGTLNAGAYKITLPGVSEKVEFHFDWLTTPDARRYLIGSQIEAREEKPAQD